MVNIHNIAKSKLRTLHRRVLYKRKFRSSYAPPNYLLSIDPELVTHYQLTASKTDWEMSEHANKKPKINHLYEKDKAGFVQSKNIGRVIGGSWDKNIRTMNQHKIYSAFRNVIMNDVEWTETNFIKEQLEKIEKGYDSYGYKTKEEFIDNRIPYLESLIESMEEFGYLPQNSSNYGTKSKSPFHEIGVNIGRDGSLIYNNRRGHNRLCCAKALNIDKISVVVIVRHEEWRRKQQQICESRSLKKLNDDMKECLPHPDLNYLIDANDLNL